MITLRNKLKKDSDIANSKNRDNNKRVSVRDKLLIKEVFGSNKFFTIQYFIHLYFSYVVVISNRF